MGFWGYVNDFKNAASGAWDNVTSGIKWGAGKLEELGSSFIPSGAKEVIDNVTGVTANRQWEQQRDDNLHYYENLVNSMLRAGLNPGMMSGGSAGSMPGTGSAAAGPGNLGVLSGIIEAFSGLQLTEAKAENTRADTQKKVEETTGQKIDNLIKEKVGLDQAYATLGLTNLQSDEKKESINLLVQKYSNLEAERLKTLSETQKIEYENESIKIANDLASKKIEELEALGDYNGRMVTMSESQAANFNGSIKILGLGGTTGVSGNQLTSTQIPLIWYVKAVNPALPAAVRKDYCQRVLWLLREDTGGKMSDLKKQSK